MAESLEQTTSCDSDRPTLQVTLENEGWSILKPVLGYSSSRSSRTHRPPPLQLTRTGAVTEDLGAHEDVELMLLDHTFDLGLGCFGQPSMVDNDGYDELAPWWTGYDQVKIAQETFDGRRVHGYEEIDLSEGSCEEERESDTDVPDEGEDNGSASSILGGQEFLEELDNLEAARPKPEKRHITIPGGDREGIWEKPSFPVTTPGRHADWIDEVAELEALVSMPEGTRYYKVNDPGESTF
ncbi:hypothetical protein F4824DRAFT_152677 [Ustulina deusta]|nr:hypothetical protein F4823DRAFT_564628 [Ustulina deusta]KAI3335631.1 hypothetical protein F4824DRAFT_152677 [Ustulina deusta]